MHSVRFAMATGMVALSMSTSNAQQSNNSTPSFGNPAAQSQVAGPSVGGNQGTVPPTSLATLPSFNPNILTTPTPPINKRVRNTKLAHSSGTGLSDNNRPGTPVLNPGLTALSQDSTDEVTQQIAIANEICSWFPLDVRIDCIADRFKAIAESIPRDSEYAPVRAALEEASADLRGISAKYSDAGTKAKRFQAPHPVDGTPVRTSRLTFVEPVQQNPAFQEALQVVNELETKLLRSSENSRARQIHYQEISAAIGSTKVLLRSA